jgi:uncharacterized protein (TIGR02145 family)
MSRFFRGLRWEEKMKKIFAVLALFTLFFAVSCGSSGNKENKDDTDTGETVTDEDSGTADSEPADTTPEQPDNEDPGRKQGELYGECYPNATCNKGLVCDEENNICIKDPDSGDDADSDVSDSTPDNGDSTPEQLDDADSADDADTSDTTDDADSADDTDSADSQPDEDDDSAEPEENCKTVDAKLWWSSKTTETMNWESAINHCKELKESNACGYSDWHLPTIDELKTLLKWRRDSQCKVSETDDHLSFDDYWTCSSCCHDCTLGGGGECNYSSYYYDGRYSKLGDSGSLWSSSVPTEYIHSAWFVNFNAAQVYIKSKSNKTEVYVRCVRGAQ